MVFRWSLSDSKSPQVSRTRLSILAVLSNAVVWIVSTRPPTSKSSRPFNNPLFIVPNAPITIGTIVTFMFHSFFNSLARSRYLSFFSLSIRFILWSVIIIIIIIIIITYTSTSCSICCSSMYVCMYVIIGCVRWITLLGWMIEGSRNIYSIVSKPEVKGYNINQRNCFRMSWKVTLENWRLMWISGKQWSKVIHPGGRWSVMAWVILNKRVWSIRHLSVFPERKSSRTITFTFGQIPLEKVWTPLSSLLWVK